MVLDFDPNAFPGVPCVLEYGILTATIHRPEAMNALNEQVISSLHRLVGWIESSKDVRVVILTGSGEKAFVAGADIRGFTGLSKEQAETLSRQGQNTLVRLERLRQPVIAMVNGFALGGGLELALACDMIFASDNAKFGLPECTLGLIPGYGGTVRLPRRVGKTRALELALSGGMISATEALQMGLVNRVFPQSSLRDEVRKIADTILSRGPLAVAAIKQSMQEGESLGCDQAFLLEARLFGGLFGTHDQREGVQAFIDKRKPTFTGK